LNAIGEGGDIGATSILHRSQALFYAQYISFRSLQNMPFAFGYEQDIMHFPECRSQIYTTSDPLFSPVRTTS